VSLHLNLLLPLQRPIPAIPHRQALGRPRIPRFKPLSSGGLTGCFRAQPGARAWVQIVRPGCKGSCQGQFSQRPLPLYWPWVPGYWGALRTRTNKLSLATSPREGGALARLLASRLFCGRVPSADHVLCNLDLCSHGLFLGPAHSTALCLVCMRRTVPFFASRPVTTSCLYREESSSTETTRPGYLEVHIAREAVLCSRLVLRVVPRARPDPNLWFSPCRTGLVS